jgi:hypothetical protein
VKRKLTPAFVAKPPVPTKDRTIYWEGNFGLVVTAKGHKSYVVQYRARGQSRRMSLKPSLSLPAGSPQGGQKDSGRCRQGRRPARRASSHRGAAFQYTAGDCGGILRP